MEKRPMCRICLAENVRMYIVVNRNLHELYEKLTDIPFVTEDRRPMLACFFCCAKLKQCYQLQRKCLEAEKHFAQMMNEDYKPNPSINHDHLEFCSGFIKCPIVHIRIGDECQPENIVIKEELPAVCEGLDVIIEPNEEHQSDELELGNFEKSCLDVADILPQHSDLEDDVPLLELNTDMEEAQAVSKNKPRARETKSAAVVKKPNLDTRRTKFEDTRTAEPTKKGKSDSKVIRATQKRTKCEMDALTKHIRLNTTEKDFMCDVCERSFRQLSSLKRHIRIHTGESPYKCDVCQRSFRDKGALTTHNRIHTGDKPFICDVCQCSFRRSDHLAIHIRKHTGEKPFKCDICQCSFREIGHLTKHIRIHTGEKPYQCDVCQRSFGDKGALTDHNRIHTGEKPFKCDICEHSFRQLSNLKRHIRIHTSEKPFKCDICERSFLRLSNLKRHIRIHTSEKPFKCDICERSFLQLSTLKRHIRIHTGEKPYQCDVCQRNFGDKGALTAHNRITHW